MIAFALLLALQTNPQIDAVVRATLSEADALGRAVERHDECVKTSVARFISSSEPADVVADVALWECNGRNMDIFEAGLALRVAGSPTSDPRELRIKMADDQPRVDAARRRMVIYYVVTQRLGMSWHMPREAWNEPLPRP